MVVSGVLTTKVPSGKGRFTPAKRGPFVQAQRGAGSTSGKGTMGTIIVGFDRSEQSFEALRWAAREASLRKANLRVVTAWEVPFDYDSTDRSIRPYDRVRQDTVLAVAGAIERAVTDSTVRESVDVVIEHGSPTPILLTQSVDAEMVVVGARGTGGFRGLILGSTTDKLTRHAKCPVVVVRSPDPE